MRAIKELAGWHADAGDDLTAQRLFSQLLEMNPADSQGIRHLTATPSEDAMSPAP